MTQPVLTPRVWHQRLWGYLAWFWFGLAVCLGLGLLSEPVPVQATPPTRTETVTLPPLRTVPLPPSLVAQAAQLAAGDYFDQVKPTEVGALIWTAFPIKVYVYPVQPQPSAPAGTVSATATAWLQAAQQAISEWQVYLPLQLLQQPDQADITLQPITPRDQGSGRVRSAETTYQPFIDTQGLLAHRCQVLVRPSQAPQYLLAALRHELGHALGIWGHSPLPSDALYFAQVRQPPPISARDVNTLRKVYQQPTRLGGVVGLAPVVPSQPAPSQATSN